MKRGDIVGVTHKDNYGSKPRPALIIQADRFDAHRSVTLIPITGELHDTPFLRIGIEPSPENGLTKSSQIMIDKVTTAPKGKISAVFGKIDDATLIQVNRSLGIFLGIF